jgi:uncharacterized small protein (DUF1192 family)
MNDDDRPFGAARSRTDAAALLSVESLEAYSLAELDGRVAALEAEIARVRAHRDKSAAHRLAAEAFFKSKPA